MRLVIVASWLALMILGGSLAAVRAADEPSSTKGAEAPSVGGAAAEIERLAAELDAPRFSERQSASEKLAALGAAALPALEKAAGGESLEVTTRAIELLKKLLDSSEASTEADARQALQRLAKSDRPKASRLAQDVLKVKEQEDAAKAMQAAQFANRQQFGPIQIGPGINAQRVGIQNNNGGREINIEQGDRKIKIRDGKGQPIKIEITTKTNGKDSTEKYEAKDVDELKKKHPEAYKFYQGWENQGNPLGFPVGVAINIMQIQQPPDQQVRMAIGILQALQVHVAPLSKGDQVQKASPQARVDLKRAVDQFQQTLAEVEKRLQEKPEAPAAKPDASREANKPQ
jgi:hypothetical protein